MRLAVSWNNFEKNMKEIVSKALRRIGSAEPILLAPLVLICTFDTAVRISAILTDGASGRRLVLAGPELSITVLLLWITVSRWAGRVAPLLFLAALRAVFSFLIGTEISYHRYSIPPAESAAAALFFVIGGTLTLRYISRKPSDWEKVALVTYVVFSLPIINRAGHVSVAVASATTGLVAITVAPLLHWLRVLANREWSAVPYTRPPP